MCTAGHLDSLRLHPCLRITGRDVTTTDIRFERERLRDRAEEAAARAQDARDRLAWVAEQRRRLAARKAMLANDADRE